MDLNNTRFLIIPCTDLDPGTTVAIGTVITTSGIRTKEGISFQKIQEQFKPHFVGLIPRWLEQGFISEKSAFYSLTRMGVFIADKISADLFI